MNQDIQKYDVYILTRAGFLKKTDKIKSTKDYDHYAFNLHHYIKKQSYDKNPEWYEQRGIKQKLILMPVETHEQVHNRAIANLSDDDFYYWYNISRWDLIFNRKHSKY